MCRRDGDTRDHLGPSVDIMEPDLGPVLIGYAYAPGQETLLSGIGPLPAIDIHGRCTGIQEPIQCPAVVRMGLGYHDRIDGIDRYLEVLEVVEEVPVPETCIEKNPLPAYVDQERCSLCTDETCVLQCPFVVYTRDLRFHDVPSTFVK